MSKRISLLLILLLLLSSHPFAQFRRGIELPNIKKRSFLYSYTYQISNGTTANVYLFVKVPFNRMIFVKNADNYSANYRFSIDVYNDKHSFVVRKSFDDTVLTKDFDKTNKNLTFSEDFLHLNLDFDDYYILPVFYDYNSQKEVKLDTIKVSVKKRGDNFLAPILVSAHKGECSGKDYYKLENFDGDIPFSQNEYDLIFPTTDTSVTNVRVALIQGKDTVLSMTSLKSFIAKNSFKRCENNIFLQNDGHGSLMKNFVLPDVNKHITEGDLKINIGTIAHTQEDTTFKYRVVWFNKPRSLFNPEFAIKMLKYEASDSIVDSLLDFNRKQYSKVLFNYWKQYDPTKKTTFNEIMDEFYKRIDYAAENFSTLSGIPGFDTDRGKIFIKFGYPQNISRTSNDLGNVLETWKYAKPEMKFVFIDKNGTGNYKLLIEKNG